MKKLIFILLLIACEKPQEKRCWSCVWTESGITYYQNLCNCTQDMINIYERQMSDFPNVTIKCY